MHMNIQSVGTQSHILFSYYFDAINDKRDFFHPKHHVKQVIFHTENDATYFNIFSLNGSGVLQNKLKIPKDSGYITYPNDASFFLWYPRLGSRVKIYNASGDILWKVNESRYIKVSQNGQYILAFSGDGSRLEFLRPDMSSIVAVEGFLMHSYELYEKSSIRTTYQACIGFLNGDIGLVNLHKGSLRRLSLKKPLKALRCNFEDNYLIAQVRTINHLHVKKNEKKANQDSSDKLIKINFDSLSFDENKITRIYDPTLEIDLGQKLITSLPIVIFQDYLVSVLPIDPDKFIIQFFDNQGNQYAHYEWPEKRANLLELEHFRFAKTKEILVVSSESMIMLFNAQGIVHKQKLVKIRRVFVKKNSLFIQTQKGILSLKI